MSQSMIPFKKKVKIAGSREIKHWHTTREEAHHLTGISRSESGPAAIQSNVLQAMYDKVAFIPMALPYCFVTKAKQEDVHLSRSR